MKTDKSIKILLAVIAINLTLLTISELDLFPKAYANETNFHNTPYSNYGLIPLNADSSITIKFSNEQLNLLRSTTPSIQDINLVQINGKTPCSFNWKGCELMTVDVN